MTIPTGEEVEAILNSIAVEMGAIRSQIKEVSDRIEPLREERTELKDKQAELEKAHNEEIKYAFDQEQKIYQIYLEAQKHWANYKEMCRQQKMAAEAGINDRVKEIRLQLWDDEQALKDLNRELESLERKWDLAQRKIKDAERYLSMQERLDKMTVGAPWREWAKDHQIDGARRIAHRGKLLLGDTMGLGKTLTAIAAMDMIRAMTAEVDAEHPLVIETN